MVAELERAGAIRSELVRQAFLAVPREQFLPDVVARDGLKAIYRTEAAIPTVTDSRGVLISSSSATAIMAPMLEALDLQPGARVLEVGAGTGYNAALLKHIVGDRGRVTSVELDAAIARRARRALAEGGHKVRVVVGDGRAGWPSGAPFDRIMVTASSDQVSQSWRDQLKEGGLVELPLHVAATLGLHSVVTFRRAGALLCSTDVIPGAFMPLRSSGEAAARPSTPPALLAVATGEGRPGTLVSLEGNGVSSLSDRAKRRALATMVGPSRRLGTLRPDAAAGLIMFLTLANRPHTVRCRIGDQRTGVAVLGPRAESIATITVRSGERGRLACHGQEGAARQLDELIAEWKQAGQPRLSDLRLAASYSSKPPRRNDRPWRNIPCPGSRIAVHWAPGGRA